MTRAVRDTSLEVYEETKSQRRAHIDTIWQVMLINGEADAETMMSYLWLAGCRWDIYEVRRRLSDLVKEGKIIDSGQRKRNAAGRNIIIWKLKRKEWQGTLF